MDEIIERAAASCGGLVRLAEVMGESIQTVSNWRSRGIPVAKCAQLEAHTNGAVRRWDMRPDDWFLIWPELVTLDGAPKVNAAA